ncbi:putative protoheme IX farnesyltransferase [Leishmania infantum JPCM5]|uniref:Protoheme IX farnesyltransferase, mitochondrial n=4 Tax=Leishmania donovani species complex TaxID=38574 RepID=A0A6L0XF01_LEIIN|nr:putative protoheme IX farnesyltransferase [Leishmania infantum JPCM5]XP_003861084.1 protoheme IX farnesyltransferase, putative [Leishmania donovani]CAC9490415.1 protoheme_IX_farnesyltransferase_-_putative [Leishmania infantum]AYU79076.1 protoheme IX farnesyltransferase, putative [Leishmania donovani]CAM68295.1 putative protoheme IX farnesyltransferase [Leishmania infantum JPCM5]CBZ34382.1 protoheme IX farnesyltransferase, putative [Leishmania donovani]SUZ42073.1 protoheme_IX_farnesyltransf|eukprot:XP_001465864.1 putative protoheme IX farnesyltransferase [Leishmania infantum JPCM5]
MLTDFFWRSTSYESTTVLLRALSSLFAARVCRFRQPKSCRTIKAVERTMLHITAARHAQLFRLTQRRLQSGTFTACPYHQAKEGSATVMAQGAMEHCPVVGTTPHMGCPVEASLCDRRPPTMLAMVSQMGKSQLSAYVAATALAGYVIAGGTAPLVAAAVTTGTMLQSCSANTANQIIEAPYDKLMKRTCRRPLPMKFLSPQAATAISGMELTLGTGLLYCVSPPAAALGVFNWFLYVCIYTPLKRVSALNTWFGSIVGGVPPLMGGFAVAGIITPPVWLLATFLFVWQIPHFNGLAFHCRRDYEAAGYKMLAFYNPWRASFYAVALSVMMAFLTLVCPTLAGMEVEGVWYYSVTAAANALMIYKSLLFHNEPVRHCRGCFVFSYVYLSVVLAAIMLNHIQPMHLAQRAIDYVAAEATEASATSSAVVSTAET